MSLKSLMLSLTKRRAFLATAILGVVPLTMLLAGIGKLSGWSEFAASLQNYAFVPAPLRVVFLVAIPALEIATFALFLFGWRVPANIACLCLLGIFTFANYWLWTTNVEPDCSCFGIWSKYLALEDSIAASFRRNGALALVSVAGIVLAWLMQSKGKTQAVQTDDTKRV